MEQRNLPNILRVKIFWVTLLQTLPSLIDLKGAGKGVNTHFRLFSKGGGQGSSSN